MRSMASRWEQVCWGEGVEVVEEAGERCQC